MLSDRLLTQIKSSTQSFWDERIKSDDIKKGLHGSEIGHSMANRVSDETIDFLKKNFKCDHQKSKANADNMRRSMGDIWIVENYIYCPVNIKFTIAEYAGRPNIVSMNKLLISLLQYKIDSYYLLYVKLSNNPKPNIEVHIFDILNYLEYVDYDAGPGQIMLKSKEFFMNVGSKNYRSKTMKEKVNFLFELCTRKHNDLIQNRSKKIEKIYQMYQNYDQNKHIVTKDTQEYFHLS